MARLARADLLEPAEVSVVLIERDRAVEVLNKQ